MHGNTVCLLMHMVDAPELIKPNETSIANFSGAWNDPFEKDKARSASFFDCKAFGKQAEIIGEYGAKGRQILVEGKLKQERWEKDGQKRSKHVIYVDSIQLVGKRHDESDDNAKPESSGW